MSAGTFATLKLSPLRPDCSEISSTYTWHALQFWKALGQGFQNICETWVSERANTGQLRRKVEKWVIFVAFFPQTRLRAPPHSKMFLQRGWQSFAHLLLVQGSLELYVDHPSHVWLRRNSRGKHTKRAKKCLFRTVGHGPVFG